MTSRFKDGVYFFFFFCMVVEYNGKLKPHARCDNQELDLLWGLSHELNSNSKEFLSKQVKIMISKLV